jgi:GNAT superfamily N-acetyltransferase
MPSPTENALRSSVLVRPATAAEAPLVARLAVQLCRQHLAYHSVRFTAFDDLESRLIALFREEIANSEACVLAAEHDGAVVGYAFVRREPESVIELSDARAWLHDIFVAPSARGLGVGKNLLDAAVSAARRLGSKTLMLQVWPENHIARETFERRGFRPTMQEMTLKLED